MFVEEFKKEPLSLSSIQFATGIALDSFNEIKYSKDIIAMYSPQNNDYDNLQYRSRDLLEEYLVQGRDGLIENFIHFLYTNDCIVGHTASGGMYKKAKVYSLKEIEHRINERQLLHEVMDIILNYKSKYFIYLYVKTTSFKNVLSKYLYTELGFSNDATRKNVYSRDVVNSILADFADFIFKYSCSAYSDLSCTPDAFLMKTFKDFYRKGESLYNILNEKSVYGNISGSVDLSLSDYQSVSLTKDDLAIDFIALAEKINKSSYSLFNHVGDDGIAYYDIFSWYRDYLAKTLYTTNRTRITEILRGINIIRPIEMEEVTGTKRDKASRRSKLCELYFKAVEDGMDVSDIYALYLEVGEKSYELCTHRNVNGGASDGSTYYEWKDLRTKSKTSNADKFKYDYEGFIALKALVDYLNSPSNSTGINVFNMPTDIFRDKRLIRRFDSFIHYISLYADVKNLMYEVDTDNVRSKRVDNYRLFENDSIFDRLLTSLQSENSKNKEVLNRVFGTPLSSGKVVVVDKNNTQVIQFQNEIRSIRKELIDHYAYISKEFTTKGIIEGIAIAKKSGNNICEEMLKPFIYVCSQYKVQSSQYKSHVITEATFNDQLFQLAFVAMNGIETLLLISGGIINEDNKYNLVDKTFSDILSDLTYADGEDITTGAKFTTTQAQFIDVSYKIALSVLLPNHLDNWEDLRTLLTISRVLQRFIYEMQYVLTDFDKELLNVPKGDNMYLIYARAASQYSLLNQKFEIDSINDIRLFFNNDPNTLLSLDITNFSLSNITAIEQRHHENIIKIVKLYLAKYRKSVFSFMNELNAKINDELMHTNDFSSNDRVISSLLARANLTIVSTLSPSPAQQRLESFCTFNNNGFVVKQNGLFTYRNSKEYIHRCGYIVTLVKNSTVPFNVEAINNDEALCIIECVKGS